MTASSLNPPGCRDNSNNACGLIYCGAQISEYRYVSASILWATGEVGVDDALQLSAQQRTTKVGQPRPLNAVARDQAERAMG